MKRKARRYLGRWKNDKAKQRFREMEDELWLDVHPAPEPIDVETRAGRTRVYRWAGDGDPIVFLHGMGGTSLMWSGYLELLHGHDVYAIDTMGDVGRSEHRVAFEGAGDLASWLDETLAGVGIEHAHLVGNSYGGYLALNLAVRRPARVASIVLLDTAGIAKFSILKFLVWGLPSLLGGFAPGPIRRWLARRLRMPLLLDKRFQRMNLYGHMNHPFRLPFPAVLTDDELRSIGVPVMLLAGAESEMMDARAIVDRARSLIPDAHAELVPDAGHGLPVSHVHECAAALTAAIR